MDEGAGEPDCPFTRRIERWRQLNLPGLMPVEVMEARLILGLCDRFHKLPSEVVAESSHLLSLLAIERMSERE